MTVWHGVELCRCGSLDETEDAGKATVCLSEVKTAGKADEVGILTDSDTR